MTKNEMQLLLDCDTIPALAKSDACSMIHETDWDTILSSDVDDAAKQWCDSFLAIMEECIPQYHLQKKRNLPWITWNIKKLIRKRNAMFRKVKRTNKNSLQGNKKHGCQVFKN